MDHLVEAAFFDEKVRQSGQSWCLPLSAEN